MKYCTKCGQLMISASVMYKYGGKDKIKAGVICPDCETDKLLVSRVAKPKYYMTRRQVREWVVSRFREHGTNYLNWPKYDRERLREICVVDVQEVGASTPVPSNTGVKETESTQLGLL